MAMAGPWLGAVQTDVRGVLVTFDAGASWRPVGQTSSGYSQGVSLVDDELRINLNGRNYIVEPTGDLRVWNGPGRRSYSYRGPATPAGTMAKADQSKKTKKPNRPVLPLGPRPLREAVLFGWPVSAKTAVVAHAGNLARVSLENGKILASEEDAYTGKGDCQAIPLGGGFGFVCGQERGRTDIYAFEHPLTMRPVISFDEPRYVGASDSGGLVIRGGCGRQRSAGNVYCVSTPKGELRELRVSGDSGVERVAMLRDGRAAVLVPPRLGAKGMLTLVDKVR